VLLLLTTSCLGDRHHLLNQQGCTRRLTRSRPVSAAVSFHLPVDEPSLIIAAVSHQQVAEAWARERDNHHTLIIIIIIIINDQSSRQTHHIVHTITLLLATCVFIHTQGGFILNQFKCKCVRLIIITAPGRLGQQIVSRRVN